MKTLRPDVVIFGGGVAGLWTLDHLVERGYSALLLEANSLGHGQTIACQGIIHGGLKYTLQGVFTSAADQIRDMPAIWRDRLRGRGRPDLSDVTIRANCCHTWRTARLRARAGEIGARLSLRVRPVRLPRDQWPQPLHGCPGDVFRLDEQVIDPGSLIDGLAAGHRDRILQIDAAKSIDWEREGDGNAVGVRMAHADLNEAIDLRPRDIVLTAGSGNETLRTSLGLPPHAMQTRPLHMVMVRGGLKTLNGHCIDAAMTPRMTVTSASDDHGRTVWQLGGKVAEDGVNMGGTELIELARRELAAVIPRMTFSGLEWATYRVDRAEAATSDRKRPSDVQVQRDANIITAWPTKLALAPRLAERIAESLRPPPGVAPFPFDMLSDWPRPVTARPPWEMEQTWIADRWEKPACN